MEKNWKDEAWKLYGHRLLGANTHSAVAKLLGDIDEALLADGTVSLSATLNVTDPNRYECLQEFPKDSAWQVYNDGARHEELLEYAIRQHQEKLSAELDRDQIVAALRKVILANPRSKGAAIAREALGWEPGETH